MKDRKPVDFNIFRDMGSNKKISLLDKTLVYLLEHGGCRPRDMDMDIKSVGKILKRGQGYGLIAKPKKKNGKIGHEAYYSLSKYGREFIEKKIQRDLVNPDITWENPPPRYD